MREEESAQSCFVFRPKEERVSCLSCAFFLWSLSRPPQQQRGSFHSEALDQSRGNATSNLSAALSGSNSTHIWKQVTVMFVGRNTPVCGPQLFTTHNRVSHPRLCGC